MLNILKRTNCLKVLDQRKLITTKNYILEGQDIIIDSKKILLSLKKNHFLKILMEIKFLYKILNIKLKIIFLDL